MALQYLDSQTIPYQVVLRLADGTYQGQWAQSNQILYGVGDRNIGQATVVGSNGGFMGERIVFNTIDWAACLPLPTAYSTDEEIMTYLSTMFTGQQGTLVPPVVNVTASIFSEPIELAQADDGDWFCSLVGSVASTAQTLAEVQLPMVACTLTRIGVFVPDTENTLDAQVTVHIYVDGVTAANFKIKADGTDGFLSTAVDIDITANQLVNYVFEVPAGAGTCIINGARLDYLLPATT